MEDKNHSSLAKKNSEKGGELIFSKEDSLWPDWAMLPSRTPWVAEPATHRWAENSAEGSGLENKAEAGIIQGEFAVYVFHSNYKCFQENLEDSCIFLF